MTPKAQATKESICKLHFIKLKTFKRTASTKRKDKPQNGSKHFQIIYVIKDLPVKYVRALKRKQSENKSLLQRGFLGGSVVESSPVSARDAGSISRKIPHAAEQLSPRTTTNEPELSAPELLSQPSTALEWHLRSSCATIIEAHTPYSPCSAPREAPVMSPHTTATEWRPTCRHQRKACATTKTQNSQEQILKNSKLLQVNNKKTIQLKSGKRM